MVAQPQENIKPLTGMMKFERGEVRRRTRGMSEDQARRFARCITANHTRYEDVHVARYASTNSWHVSWLPANPKRAAALVLDQQARRQAKAAAEGAHYEFHEDPDNRSLWWVIPVSGEPYELGFDGSAFVNCTCADFHYRKAVIGQCKHLIAGNSRRVWAVAA